MLFYSRILTVRRVHVVLLSFEIHLPCLLSLLSILVISSRISEPLLKSIIALTQKFLCRYVLNVRALRLTPNRSVFMAINDATSRFRNICDSKK